MKFLRIHTSSVGKLMAMGQNVPESNFSPRETDQQGFQSPLLLETNTYELCDQWEISFLVVDRYKNTFIKDNLYIHWNTAQPAFWTTFCLHIIPTGILHSTTDADYTTLFYQSVRLFPLWNNQSAVGLTTQTANANGQNPLLYSEKVLRKFHRFC